jgi:hypothetical protein
MENADHAVAIAKWQLKQSVPAVLLSQHAARTHSPFKSLMEFGEAFRKMIAL